MSQADVDVVLDQFAATNERDFQRAMDAYANDVVLVIGGDFLNAGIFEGKEAVGEWFGDWLRQFGADYRFDIIESRDLGDGLVYLFARYGGSGRVSGAEVYAQAGYLYRVTRGKIERVQIFASGEEALEAASLPEWSEGEAR